jgi:glutathione S-transferase
MSSLKPIKLYGHGPGPNPWKVVMVFEELNIP